MKNSLIFAKRNGKEMLRDPVLYIFCLGFPVGMLALFSLISHYAGSAVNTFAFPSLVPGVMMFSFTFMMLVVSLLVSKDKSTAFLKRLYTSPMRPWEFVLGYAIPSFAVGVGQAVVCVLSGWALSAVTGETYFSFGRAVLLILSQLPILLCFLFLGLLLGSCLREKSAPGITSVFITASGILGGAWMPLDTMGEFETFCRFLPFYPSVYLGRILTGAEHTVTDYLGVGAPYAWEGLGFYGLLPIVLCLIGSLLLSFLSFRRQMTSDS